MPSSSNKPKLRRWQFSLRKFFMLLTLCCVLAGLWRYREWGRELTVKRDALYWKAWTNYQQENLGRELETRGLFEWLEPEEDFAAPFDWASQQTSHFTEEHWLPITFYELTSNSNRAGRCDAFEGSGPLTSKTITTKQ